MLDRHKLAKEIDSLGKKLFPDTTQQMLVAQEKWEKIIRDPSFEAWVHSIHCSVLIPTWNNGLGGIFAVDKEAGAYTLLAVDGSQIYPDRHIAGVGCFLINMGGCLLSYGSRHSHDGLLSLSGTSSAHFFSEPHLLLPENIMPSESSIPFTEDLVDVKRGEIEFETMVKRADLQGERFLCLCDGSLIFWNLDGKPEEVRDFFLQSYLGHLNALYEKKVLIAGYISMPKSKELVNLIKLAFCRERVTESFPCLGTHAPCQCSMFDDLVDADILWYFLQPFQRTTLFYNQSKITEYYPAHLKPCFFYLHVGKEVVRVEIPAWIAQSPNYLDFISKVCIDQSLKGQGYPVALAEAHEQAVVKGCDREFFYHLIRKIGIMHNVSVVHSQKSIKKRGLGI